MCITLSQTTEICLVSIFPLFEFQGKFPFKYQQNFGEKRENAIWQQNHHPFDSWTPCLARALGEGPRWVADVVEKWTSVWFTWLCSVCASVCCL